LEVIFYSTSNEKPRIRANRKSISSTS